MLEMHGKQQLGINGINKITRMRAKFIYEAFEEKDKDTAKRELLYPGIKDIDDFWDFKKAVENGIPPEAIPEKKLEELFRKARPYEIEKYQHILSNSSIKFPTSIIKERIDNADSLSELQELSKVGEVTEEKIQNVINNAKRAKWSMISYSGYPGIDPCTYVDMDVTTLKDISENCGGYIYKFLENFNIEILPYDLSDSASSRNFDLYFVSNKDTEDQDDIDFTFLLKRKYKENDINKAWKKFLDDYYPSKKEVRSWRVND